MRVEVTTPPGAEPVLLADAKAHCRIEVADDDALISGLIVAARETAERFLNRKLIDQTLKMSLDACDSEIKRAVEKRAIRLLYGPVSAINSVKFFASNDTETVFDPSGYRLSGDRVVLRGGSSWPSWSREFDAIEVSYIAGYGAAGTNVPEPIKLAIKLLVAHYYESREAAGDPVISEAKEMVIPFGVQQILMPFRIYVL